MTGSLEEEIRHRERGHVKTEPEIGVTQPHGREVKHARSTRRGREAWTSLPLTPQGSSPADTWVSEFCCFKPGCLWSLGAVAQDTDTLL